MVRREADFRAVLQHVGVRPEAVTITSDFVAKCAVATQSLHTGDTPLCAALIHAWLAKHLGVALSGEWGAVPGFSVT